MHTGHWSTEQPPRAETFSDRRKQKKVMKNAALLVCFLKPVTVTGHLTKAVTKASTADDLFTGEICRAHFQQAVSCRCVRVIYLWLGPQPQQHLLVEQGGNRGGTASASVRGV